MTKHATFPAQLDFFLSHGHTSLKTTVIIPSGTGVKRQQQQVMFFPYKVGNIHYAIFDWMSAIHSEFQLGLLFLLLLFL